jgi:hypothetical protein
VSEISELSKANELLAGDAIKFLWHASVVNWIRLHSTKKGFCSVCGKEGKTYLHHLNPDLKPPKLYYVGKQNTDLTIPYGRVGESGSTIYINFLDKNIDLIYQSIRYYAVNKHEVIELCASCHGLEHSQNKNKLEEEKENYGKQD